LKAVIVGDLITLGMEHVGVSIPNLGMVSALPLFHDFLKRSECIGKAVNCDDAPAATVEVLVVKLKESGAQRRLQIPPARG
jgi:hypothetical protein